MRMTFPTIEHASGHKLIDNGVGDYDLQCPSGGYVFVPYMVAVTLTANRVCPTCREKIGERLD